MTDKRHRRRRQPLHIAVRPFQRPLHRERPRHRETLPPPPQPFHSEVPAAPNLTLSLPLLPRLLLARREEITVSEKVSVIVERLGRQCRASRTQARGERAKGNSIL